MADEPKIADVRALDITIHVPAKDAFGGDAYKGAGELAELGYAVIAKHPDRLKAAKEAEVRFLWKANGGKTEGRPNYADCQHTGGLVAYFGGCDFVVWFAADHLTEVSFMQSLFEPLMFRMLCHIGRNEQSKSLIRVGADFTGFTSEVEHYGMWDIALKQLGRVQSQQIGLFDGLEAPAGWEQPPLAPVSATPPNGNISQFPNAGAASDAAAEAAVNSGRAKRGKPADDAEPGAAKELAGVGAE